jgi:hypothetical protein
MDITISTPALLFPAVSLLLLAYTNRFLGLAGRIRSLAEKYKEDPAYLLLDQIHNLRRRVNLIQQMQACGVLSLVACVLSMFSLFWGLVTLGKVIFCISLMLMLVSLFLSLAEISSSVNALNLLLSDIESQEKQPIGVREER